MFKVLKITIYIILFILLTLSYFIYTDSGKKLSYNILNFVVTQKIGLRTKVVELDLSNYPYMKTKLVIERKYKIEIDGYYENRLFDLDYTLSSDCIVSDVCKVNGDVNITGKIAGPRKTLLITGQGNVLDGNISYVATKKRHSFTDVHLGITDINSTNLFKLLGQKAILEGSASGSLDFDVLSHKKRRGVLYYTVKDKDYHGLEVDLDTKIEIKDEMHTFNMKVKTPTARLNLIQGEYNQDKRKASVVYQLDIQNVTDLKKVLKVHYNAPFYSVGKLYYDHKKISMQGFSESLGGMLDLVFKENKLHFYLSNTPLSPLMEKFEIDPIADTHITGRGVYDTKQKTVTFDASLSDFKFRESKLTQSLLKSSDIDLSKEIFDNNHLHVQGIDGEVSTSITVQNKTNHLTFNEIKVNSDNHSVQSFIDLHMYKYYLKGDLYLKIDKYTAAHDTYINFDGTMQKHYAVTLKGLVNKKWTSMDYSLASARLPSHICTIVDDVNLTGHMSGPFTRLNIEGEGKALNGHVKYSGIKKGDTFKAVSIEMQNIHAKKISTLLGHPDLPTGKVDLEAEFDLLSTTRQKGNIHYVLSDSILFDLPFTLDTNVKVNDTKETFEADITLAGAKINLSQGLLDLETKQTKAFYTLDVQKLETLEDLLGYKYLGAFYAVGTVVHDGNYTLHGLSKTFDGLTEFNYEDDLLDIKLSDVSFKRIMALFPYPTILDAVTTGKIKYDFKEENLTVRTKLKNAKFSYIEEMDDLYQKSGINLLKETFTDTQLDINYKNKDILANLIMKNEKSHLSLTNTLINTKHNSINAYFSIKMQGKEFSGKVYGPLDKPKVNLNMQKLIRHEMDRQLDSIVGEGNRKMMEAMPMGDVAKDMASGVGGAFMGVFF